MAEQGYSKAQSRVYTFYKNGLEVNMRRMGCIKVISMFSIEHLTQNYRDCKLDNKLHLSNTSFENFYVNIRRII